MSEPEPTLEEIRHRDSLVTQRESLLEKLVEYSVGTQSNTVDGVKRAVWSRSWIFECVINVFIIGFQTSPGPSCPLCFARTPRGCSLTDGLSVAISR
jgi:hypothetical protein